MGELLISPRPGDISLRGRLKLTLEAWSIDLRNALTFAVRSARRHRRSAIRGSRHIAKFTGRRLRDSIIRKRKRSVTIAVVSIECGIRVLFSFTRLRFLQKSSNFYASFLFLFIRSEHAKGQMMVLIASDVLASNQLDSFLAAAEIAAIIMYQSSAFRPFCMPSIFWLQPRDITFVIFVSREKFCNFAKPRQPENVNLSAFASQPFATATVFPFIPFIRRHRQ